MSEENHRMEASVKRELRVLYAEAMISVVGARGFDEIVVEKLVEATFERVRSRGKLMKVFSIIGGGDGG
jgi:hypothetical protein